MEPRRNLMLVECPCHWILVILEHDNVHDLLKDIIRHMRNCTADPLNCEPYPPRATDEGGR